MSAYEVKGWCPGALRPMESGDGLLTRLKFECGAVSLRRAAAAATWSRRWGNGHIDLTVRANLQLRGLARDHLPAFHRALREQGWFDETAAEESVRNVIVNPLAGLDREALIDPRPMARALVGRLAADLQELPAKFGFAIDDGGRWPVAGCSADLLLQAILFDGAPAVQIWLEGFAGGCLGPCAPDEAIDAACAVARVFGQRRRAQGAQIRRMRDLAAVMGIDEIARRSGSPLSLDPRPKPSAPDASSFLGAHSIAKEEAASLSLPRSAGEGTRTTSRGANPPALPQAKRAGEGWRGRESISAFLGVGLPFGRISAEGLLHLVKAANRRGAHELRLTPWRAILVPVTSLERARDLALDLQDDGLILSAVDPRRRVASCVGAPACAHATTDVRADAMRMAALLVEAPGPEIRLHVSGCAKGCAHRGAASMVLIGRAGGYDALRDGCARDDPQRLNLSPQEAESFVKRALADSRRSLQEPGS